MNRDEIKSVAGQVATAICFLLAGAGVTMTSGQSSEIVHDVTVLAESIGAAIPTVLGLISVVGSVYRHWNQKKVPETAIIVGSGK